MSGAGFYHLADVDISEARCQGTACFAARHRDPGRWERAQAEPRVYCLGKCYRAPAAATDDELPRCVCASSTPVLLERIAKGPADTLASYRDNAGLVGLQLARRHGPEWALRELETSALRGRGGAAFSTGRKWRTVRQQHRQHAGAAYVVCNADEGDPGAYIDRILLEQDPFAVLEGMLIAAQVVGATKGYVYVRREYPAALDVIRGAIAEARDAGILAGFEVEVVEGQGSYVCGEETALLNALEGRRPEVRARPPYPAQHGLFGAPTVVNNVETLAAIPWIIRNSGATYAALGSGDSRGTKLVSLNSLLHRPGLYEVEFGCPVRHIIEGLGGGLDGGTLWGVQIGGPLAGILPTHLLDTSFTFEDLHKVGADIGHGGIVAFDEHTTIEDLVRHVFRFGAFESCGKCTPCRVGTSRLLETQIGSAQWRHLVDALRLGSLCGHGTGLAAFADSITTHFAQELQSCPS